MRRSIRAVSKPVITAAAVAALLAGSAGTAMAATSDGAPHHTAPKISQKQLNEETAQLKRCAEDRLGLSEDQAETVVKTLAAWVPKPGSTPSSPRPALAHLS